MDWRSLKKSAWKPVIQYISIKNLNSYGLQIIFLGIHLDFSGFPRKHLKVRTLYQFSFCYPTGQPMHLEMNM